MLELVNIKQGSKSVPRFSAGNTLPLVQLPFGMASFAPQTDSSSGNWFYHPEHRIIEGIRLTHQPSPWIGDYGPIVFFPQIGEPVSDSSRASGFRCDEAILTPYYMNINFLRSRCVFELTPTERGAHIRLTFSDTLKPFLSVLPAAAGFHAELDAENNRVIGYSTYHSIDKAESFKEHFILQFDNDVIDIDNTITLEEGIHIALKTVTVNARVAISYISLEQANENLKQDSFLGSFEAAQKNAEKCWEDKLSLINVTTDDEDLKKTFYSCLYRVFLYPHKAYEIDKTGNTLHYCPFYGDTRDGIRYTDNGLWDTYRTVYPLLSIISPEDYAEILDGFVQDFRDCGWLPRWSSIGAVDCMPSTLIDAVIADAAVKGIGSKALIETAFEGMLKHAENESHMPGFGRNGAAFYNEHGYVPYEDERETVNLTLDAAYGDFCIATVAEVLGKKDIAEKYRKKALNYKNLFDPETGFMRAKDKQGNFRPDFDPIRWGGDYTEGSAWQNSFAVPHDIDGLADLYGGKAALSAKMDELFATPPYYRVGFYGFEIHEMTEMAALNFGQCGMNNQPSFHIPFIYAALGETEKSKEIAQRICREVFSFRDDGFPGDEDNGTTAAWFVLTSLGIYQLCPGKAEYINLGSSLFKKINICGKEFDPSALPEKINHSVFKN